MDLSQIKEESIMKYEFKEWIKAAGIRALKTVAQTAIAMIGTSVLMGEVDWVMVGSAALLAGILSLLTSVAGLPELDKKSDAASLPDPNKKSE